MAENKMKEVAKLLGVEMGVPFNIKDKNGVELMYSPFTFKDDGLYDKYNDNRCCHLLNCLLNGACEIEQPILTKKEKTYLEGVLRPFKDRYISIQKRQHGDNIFITLYVDNDYIPFPDFKKDEMYKGLVLNKRYTLEELGLFVDENVKKS